MDWKQLHDHAMKALMNGDNSEAIGYWRESVAVIERDNPQVTLEMGQLFYGLGKTLGDDSLDESIALLSKAEKLISSVDPNNAVLRQVQYDLGNMLARSGRSDEATSHRKSAMGIVDEPIAKCFQGKCKDSLDLKKTIKIMQKHGLLNELSPKEFKRLHAVLVENGKADDGDVESINPFDLFYEYYQDENREKTDSCYGWEVDYGFDVGVRLKETLACAEVLNELLGEQLVTADDIKIVTVEPWSDTSGDKVVAVAYDKKRADGLPIVFDPPGDLVYVYNKILADQNSPHRIMRFAAYDERDMIIVLTLPTITTLYKSGAAHIFENPNIDVEPDLFPRNTVPFS